MHASDAAVFAKQALDLPWLQPPLPMAAAPTNYGCSPRHLWLQPPSPMVAGAQLAGRGEGRGEGRPNRGLTLTSTLTLTPTPAQAL